MNLALVVEQLLAPVPGGTGRYAGELAAALARTAAPGDTVTGWVAGHRDVRGAVVDGVRGPRRVPLPRVALARAWVRGVGPGPRGADVVQTTTPLAPPARRGVPLVVAVHDTVPWTDPDTLTAHGARWHRDAVARAATDAAAVTVLTEAVARELVVHVPQLDPARVHVLGAGVSPGLLAAAASPDLTARRTRLGLADTDYVVTLATLEPRKGLDVAVAALAALPADGRPVLACVGQPGWGGTDPLALAGAAGLPDGAVRVLGRVPETDLAAVLTGARALLAPSRAEGFGLPVAEAMALGVPVVASDIAPHAEVTAGAARLVPVGDAAALAAALAALLADDDARARLAAAGRTRAAALTWDAVARRAWALHHDLAGGGGRIAS